MLAAVTSAITTVISWVGTVITALTGSEGAFADLLPLFAIGIAISAVLLGICYAPFKRELELTSPLIAGNSL